MHSSTSSSKSEISKAWILTLLAGLILILLGAEWLTRILIIPSSRVLSRYAQEAAAAQTPDKNNRRLLICGNSTLVENVDFPALQGSLQPNWEAQRWSMDDTRFHDWYYAFRRLRRQHNSPTAMVIVLAPFQMLGKQVRGTFFAHYLMAPEDIFRISQDLSMHPTESVALAAAVPSQFYATQQDVRKTFARKLMPFLPDLMSALVSEQKPKTLSKEQEQEIYRERLGLLAKEGKEAGIRVLLVIPSLRDESPSESLLQDVGRELGVTVLLPLPSGKFPKSFYRDGLHMTPEGARAFTPLLSKALSDTLGQLR